MTRSRLLLSVTVTLLCSAGVSAVEPRHTPIGGQGTWEATLQARDVDGNGTIDAYYDTAQDMTWLADAFIVYKSGYSEYPTMTRLESQGYIWDLNASNLLGVDDWRLPHYNYDVYVNCLGTAYNNSYCGYNADPEASELNYLFLITLGNYSIYDTEGNYVGAGRTLNTGPFVFDSGHPVSMPLIFQHQEAQGNFYATGNDYALSMHNGKLSTSAIHSGLTVPWLVRDGDIGGTVPSQVAAIDVDPYSAANEVSPNSNNMIAVAVLGSSVAAGDAADLDVSEVNPASVRLGVGQAVNRAWPLVDDFDGDGQSDIAFGFRTQATGIVCEDTEVTLTAQTYKGVLINGTDTIATSDCESTGCHP